MVHIAFVCTPCCILLHVFGSCYANFEIGQTSNYVKTQHCCQQLLGVVGLHPFACSSTNARRMPGKGSGMGTLGLIAFKRIIRFFWNPALLIIPALLRLCCPKPIPAGKLKTLSRRECWGRTSSGNSIEAGYYERQIWQPLPLFPIHS